MSTLVDNLDVFILGFGNTLLLFFWSAIFSLLGGIVLSAMRVSPIGPLRASSLAYITLVRNTPLTLVFLAMVVAYPKLNLIDFDYLTLAVIALSLYTSTYVAEVIRSGINTVPIGQAEAARALGMRFGQTLGLVVLPQALRGVIPPIMSVFIALLKNTTVAGGFSVVEAGSIRAYLSERSEPAMVVLLWVMLIFIIVVGLLTLLQRYFEKRWQVSR